MRYFELPLTTSAAYQPVLKAYRVDETSHVRRLCQALQNSFADNNRIREQASELVSTVRANRASGSGVDALMQEYQLSSQEGVVLMCLAEALLRTPDEATVDRLIEDKLGSGDWQSHLGNSESLFVNASTWGLVLSGRIIQQGLPADQGRRIFRRLVQRAGEPLAPGGPSCHAHHGPAVCHGPHGSRSLAAFTRTGSKTLPAFL